MQPILSVRDLSKNFGAFAALGGVSFDVRPKEKVGIIGPNGSGKTTLINCISGNMPVDGGSISFAGENVTRLEPHKRTHRGIVRSYQIPRPFWRMSVIENVYVPLQYVAGFHQSEPREEALRFLDLLRLADKADEPCQALTQVDLRKLELARALACNPKLLLADEVMAGLSSREVDEILGILEDLSRRDITIIMIEHIMRAITSFSGRVLCLVAGRLVADGPPQAVVNNPDVKKAYLGD